MTSIRWRSARAALVAAVFGLFTAESIALPACPMHTGGAHDSAQRLEGSDTHAGHGAAHLSTSQQADPSAGLAEGSGNQTHSTECDCLGACAGAGVVGLAPARTRLVVTVDRAVELLPIAYDAAPARGAHHRQPFAIPPPHSA